jgi:hypothetical protein
MGDKPRLPFGYNQGLPEYVEAAWGCRAIVTQDGDVDVVHDRTSTYGSDDAFRRLAAHLDTMGRDERWKARASALLTSREMDTRVAGEHVLVDDGTVIIKGNTNGSGGYLYVCAYTAYQRIPEPEIPEALRPFLAHYLRWLGNDDGTHGGMHCRWDRNDLAERADRIHPGPVDYPVPPSADEMDGRCGHGFPLGFHCEAAQVPE